MRIQPQVHGSVGNKVSNVHSPFFYFHMMWIYTLSCLLMGLELITAYRTFIISIKVPYYLGYIMLIVHITYMVLLLLSWVIGIIYQYVQGNGVVTIKPSKQHEVSKAARPKGEVVLVSKMNRLFYIPNIWSSFTCGMLVSCNMTLFGMILWFPFDHVS